MAGETTSTNMSLPIPGTGVTAGPDWANDYNSCLTIIDAHTHSAGSGVQITPSGLNINSDLTFGSNSATALKKAAFTSQSSALTGTNFLTFVSGNLYVNDGSGNQIAITAAGSVAGTAGSIASLTAPASATYVAGSKLFQWQSGASKAAAMDNGAVTIRETDVASAKGITLASPSSLAADYQITLPAALPSSTQYLTSTNAGVTSFSTANSIAAAVTRSTGTTVSAGGVAISNSCSNFSTTSSSLTDVTNLSVTITTSGRPVQLMLIDDGNGIGSGSGLRVIRATTTTFAEAEFAMLRGATVLSTSVLKVQGASSSVMENSIPPGALSYIDAVGAGTYTYKVQAQQSGFSSQTAYVQYCKLVAYEL